MFVRVAPRRIRANLESGSPSFGVCIQLPSPDAVEIAGYAGLDFAWIDAEHGTIEIGDVNHMVRAADAAGIDAIVRVPDHGASFVQKVLDIGAAGIIVPHMRSVEVARNAAAAARYAPEGVRGACPSVRAVGHLSADWPADMRRARTDILVFGLVEDVEGVENVEDIAGSSYLDGLIFGPFDLSTAMGLDHADATIAEMGVRVRKAAVNAGIQFLALPGLDGSVETLAAEGVKLFNVSSDRGLLFMAFSSAMAEAKSAFATAGQGSRP